jgi:hypothetical protein
VIAAVKRTPAVRGVERPSEDRVKDLAYPISDAADSVAELAQPVGDGASPVAQTVGAGLEKAVDGSGRERADHEPYTSTDDDPSGRPDSR